MCALAGALLAGGLLAACSHYPDEFATEGMIIYQLDTTTPATETTARLTWKTNRPGTSEVYYRRVDSPEASVIQEDEVLDHDVRLTGLFPSTEYFCRVASQNKEGFREVVSDVVLHTLPWPPVVPVDPPL